LDTSVIQPATPLGSPPATPRPDIEQLTIAAYGALRSHPAMLSMLGAPLHDWFAAGGEIRQAMRDVTEAVLAAMPQPPAPRAVIDALHDGCAAAIAGLEASRDVVAAERDHLAKVIDAASGPRVTAADLAPVLWTAYASRIRASLPEGLAAHLADWDTLPQDHLGDLARESFTAVASMALGQARADYDQAAELIRAQDAERGLRAQVFAIRQLCQAPEQAGVATRVLEILGTGE
jgi:hypothetical protein